MQIRVKVFELKQELERHEHRSYSVQEIADAAGISRHTLTGLLERDVKTVYFETLIALLQFFRTRGLAVGLHDILVLEE